MTVIEILGPYSDKFLRTTHIFSEINMKFFDTTLNISTIVPHLLFHLTRLFHIIYNLTIKTRQGLDNRDTFSHIINL